MSEEFFCKICAINCTGKAPFEQHLQSAKHIKKAQGNVVVPSSPSQTITRSQSSTTSNISEATPSSFSTPFSSDTMRILLEWNHPRGYKPYCDICHVHLHGEGNADRHFQSTNLLHCEKLAACKAIRNDRTRYFCTVCSEIFNDEDQMSEHFRSTAHQVMAEQKEILEKFIQIYQTYDKLKQVRRQNKDRLSTPKDNLADAFEFLKITNGTESKCKGKQSGLFSTDKLQEAMQRRRIEDDDD